MNITKISLENNRVTILMIIVITILGLISYTQLSRDAMPPFTIRFCQVVTNFPGASPERVEKLVTDKIEKVVQEIPELKTVTSESRTGLSVVIVELNPDVTKEELQPVWDKIRRKIEEIRPDLPENIFGPNVKDDAVGVTYGIQLGMEADGYSYAELKVYAEKVRDDLIKLKEVARVAIGGDQKERIFIEFDNASLAQYGLSSNKIKNAVSATNIVFPGGDISLENERILLEPTGNYESLEDVKNTLIRISPTEMIKLGDITNIRFGYQTPQADIIKVNGNKGLVLAVNLSEGANLSNLGDKIDEKLQYYNSTLPIGISIQRVASQDTYVNGRITDFVSNVFQSIFIVLLVMLAFLGFRTGMVVASLIPLTMVLTLLIMNFLEVGLNQVTLASLIMALGLLVDNSIVVSESILVKIEKGTEAKEAAISSAKELTLPLLISTLTTSSAFLPFYLAQNSMGEMMGNIFIVITIALLSSWILALSFVAMLSVYFIKVKKGKTAENGKKAAEKPGFFDKLNVEYKKILVWTLRKPILFSSLVIGMFIGSMALFPQLPFIFMPDSDRNLVIVDVNLPQGSKIEETEAVMDSLSAFIDRNLVVPAEASGEKEGVTSFTAFIAEGPNSYDLGYQTAQPNSGYAHMLVNTTSFEANNAVIEAIDQYAFASFPNAEISVGPMGAAGGSKYDVGVRVSGENPDKLMEIAAQIKRKMSEIKGVKNFSDDWGPRIKKVLIDIDQDKAGQAGITNQDVAISLRTALTGFDIGDFRDLDGNIPLMLQSKGGGNLNVQNLESVTISSQMTGRNVPLGQVANIGIEWQIAKIMRKDILRTITINCDARPGVTATDITSQLTPELDVMQREWGLGYSYALGGENERSNEALGAVADNLPIAGFIILLLLMLQFNSYRKTFIVLASIPLGMIGVILGLHMFQSYFGFMAFLGMISLAGIVVNDTIVLLEKTDIAIRDLGKKPYDAIIYAAQQKFRPVLLTTFTTVLGLIPLYLGGGLMWEPMAVAIMIGLMFATIIILLFVPVMYKVLFRIKSE
jgi:multidrug efflux pump subunit AcrB